MSCEKTGALVFLETHGLYILTDVHRSGDTVYFRTASMSHTPHRDCLHYRVDDYVSWFHENTKEGVMICRACEVRYYGYTGTPI